MIVTLLSDFGLRDSYVAEMKAVILSHAPEATIVDISHDVEKFNVKRGAYLLARSVDFFPRGTIHVGVVDPQVGSSRHPIAVETEKATLIGPDNGLLFPAAKVLGFRRFFVVENKNLLPEHVSATFHGRDIFAHVAGYLAAGMEIAQLGHEISGIETGSQLEPRIFQNSIEGEIVHIDDFGNVVTNINQSSLKVLGIRIGQSLRVRIDNKLIGTLRFLETYSEVETGSIVAVIGSGGFIELSINQGNAAIELRARPGQMLVVEAE